MSGIAQMAARLLALGALLALAGCASSMPVVNSYALSNQLRIGMTNMEVITAIGSTPVKQETHGKTEFLFYQTGFGGLAADKLTPLAIEDGKLVSWGWPYYTATAKAAAAEH